MLLRILAAIPLITIALLASSAASAIDLTQPFSICIGDACAGSGNFNLSCDFAYAHAADTDKAAAEYVCTILNDFSSYSAEKISNISVSKCGELVVTARCHN